MKIAGLKEGDMARIGFGLDVGSTYPKMELQLISGEALPFPEGTGESYSIFLIYRGYW